MRPQYLAVTAVGTSNPIPLDFRAQVFNVTITGKISSGGSAAYSVQYTTDPILEPGYDPNNVNNAWFPITGLTTVTANAVGNIVVPVTAVRVVTTAVTGTLTIAIIHTSGQG